MTYYGRWTYKYEKAAELGAAGVFIVHETAPAGYPFAVVQGFGGERFDLVTPDKNMGRAAVQGWLSLEAATALLKVAGHDYQALKAQAATREFKPVPLGATASMSFTQTMRTVELEERGRQDHGQRPDAQGRVRRSTPRTGITSAWASRSTATTSTTAPRDNASGTALALEIARAFKKVQPAPKRTCCSCPSRPRSRACSARPTTRSSRSIRSQRPLANINIDGINQWGRTKDLTVIGLGASDLDDYAREAAKEQGRVLRPDAEPEKGFYYRSDHFNFAKKGVPAFDPDSGIDFIGKPEGYGKQKRDEYTSKDYHEPSDQVKPDWDLERRGRRRQAAPRDRLPRRQRRRPSRRGSPATSSRRFATSRSAANSRGAHRPGRARKHPATWSLTMPTACMNA